MRPNYVVLGLAFATCVASTTLAPTAQAQDSIYVPLLTYRTGPFAGSGVPIANGILTTEDDDQALARMAQKGGEAGQAAVEMANLQKFIQK